MPHYFDTERPTLFGNTKCLSWPHGPGQPLPSFYVEPEKEGDKIAWRIGVMCRTSHNGASYRYVIVDDLNAFGARWLASPEDVLRAEFGYDGTYADKPSAQAERLADVTADIFG